MCWRWRIVLLRGLNRWWRRLLVLSLVWLLVVAILALRRWRGMRLAIVVLLIDIIGLILVPMIWTWLWRELLGWLPDGLTRLLVILMLALICVALRLILGAGLAIIMVGLLAIGMT